MGRLARETVSMDHGKWAKRRGLRGRKLLRQRTRGLDKMEQIILGILECQAERVGSVATQGETGTPRVGQQEWVTEERRRRSSELRV